MKFGAAGVVAVLLMLTAPAAGQTDGLTLVPAPSRNVTPPGILPGPVVDGPLLREETPLPAADPPRWHRLFLPQTHDSATFEKGDIRVRVADVQPPSLERTCATGEGGSWPCGRTARHALRMYLRGRAVECYFPFSVGLLDVTAPCRVGRTDLALWLLANGWVEAGSSASESYRQAEADAKCARRGLWREHEPDCR
ncbi:MAG: thermonuclease family protein [Alphaproteobacteria bacterium]